MGNQLGSFLPPQSQTIDFLVNLLTGYRLHKIIQQTRFLKTFVIIQDKTDDLFLVQSFAVNISMFGEVKEIVAELREINEEILFMDRCVDSEILQFEFGEGRVYMSRRTFFPDTLDSRLKYWKNIEAYVMLLDHCRGWKHLKSCGLHFSSSMPSGSCMKRDFGTAT